LRSWKLLGVTRRMVAALKADEGREWDAEIHELECAIAEAIGKPKPARPKERCRERADHQSRPVRRAAAIHEPGDD
jgi:hypothetical protein